ncbi:DUF6274 family protein [Streptomyces sp. NPDC005752]|uniref:DUF6274 family protein n=1 Tax=Streptomyces sp. NPDC005752 TaxID=3157065 RepID=UPI0033E3134A
MPAPTERHETRALLRAHLAAASGYRHLTPNCPICHRLLRLAMEPLTAPQAPYAPTGTGGSSEPQPTPETAPDAPARDAGASHRAAGPTAAGDEAGADGARDHPHGHPGDESPPAT